jgi:hypothetical protein
MSSFKRPAINSKTDSSCPRGAHRFPIRLSLFHQPINQPCRPIQRTESDRSCWSPSSLALGTWDFSGVRSATPTCPAILSCGLVASKRSEDGIFRAKASVHCFLRISDFGLRIYRGYPSPPQFIRPTVPRSVNIDDFACFIRPNVRPRPSHDPSHPSQGAVSGLDGNLILNSNPQL